MSAYHLVRLGTRRGTHEQECIDCNGTFEISGYINLKENLMSLLREKKWKLNFTNKIQ